MGFTLSASLLALAIGAGMAGLIETGRRLGARRIAADPEGARTGQGAVEGAVFGLMGLLIAFTFSGAAARFDARRQLIIEEANAIGTAWLRLDLLPEDARTDLREKFRDYLEARLEVYRRLPDLDAALAQLARCSEMQTAIWAQAVAATQDGGRQPAAMLLLPALNQMFDIASVRTGVTRMHPPKIIFVLLCGLALVSALLAGYAMAGARRRGLLHMALFAVVMAGCVYVILDLEYPRFGFIRIDAADQPLVELLDGMKPR